MYVHGLADTGPAPLAVLGGKGANLVRLVRAGAPVPPGFVLGTAAYRAFVAHNGLGPRLAGLARGADPDASAAAIAELFAGGAVPGAVRAELLAAYAGLGAAVPVAVRSSATAEDLAEASSAGQQESFLNVRGEPALLAAVRACWASLWTARALAYRARRGVDPDELALAVVVQRMVDARASGVMFTADPRTGRRDTTVVSAAWGLGEAVVSGRVTPDDLVLAGGRVLERRTADKQVMTVPADAGAGTVERPVPAALRGAPVLDDARALALAGLGARVQQRFGAPQDIEWVLGTDDALYLVQARPVTALPEEAGPAPTSWPRPDGHDVFFRGSIVEQLPDPLSPLFADLTERLVVRGMIRTIGEYLGTGREVFAETDMSFPTINGYAYYGFGNALFRKMLRLLPVAVPIVRGSGAASGVQRWRERFRPRYAAEAARWNAQDPAGLSAAELLAGVQELALAGFAYYTSVQTVIPAAATAELLFTWFYDRLVKRPGDPAAQTFLLGEESEPIRAEASLWVLARWVRDRSGLAAALTAGTEVPDRAPDGVDAGVWAEWQRRLGEHLARHGHAVWNLDVLNPVAADDPGPVLETLRFYLRGGGQDPTERRRGLLERREAATAGVRARLSGWRLRRFDRLLARARSLGPVREDALAGMGLGWPALRRLALELGARLRAAGVLAAPAEVFWLRLPELEAYAALLDAGDVDPAPAGGRVAERRRTWRARKSVSPPPIVPERGPWHVLGAMMPNVMGDQSGPVLRGTAASGGTVTASARVVSGPEDFAALREGEVLVAAITTPAWTPLFVKAAAVVTDVGGPLSHSSIVAREYGIPAVLGTTVATSRIRTGDRITVDGTAGTVTLAGAADAAERTPPRSSGPLSARPARPRPRAPGGTGPC